MLYTNIPFTVSVACTSCGNVCGADSGPGTPLAPFPLAVWSLPHLLAAALKWLTKRRVASCDQPRPAHHNAFVIFSLNIQAITFAKYLY